MTTHDAQMETVQVYARFVQKAHSGAIGVALMFFECGCIQGAPFDSEGQQVGAVTHLGQTVRGEVRICEECVQDGGAPERVTRSGMLFFDPSALSEEEKDQIMEKIFVDSPPS